MSDLHYTTNTTPEGDFHCIIDDHDVVLASGFGDIQDLRSRLPKTSGTLELQRASGHGYEGLIEAYYAGDKTALDGILMRQQGTDFQQRIWQAISRIPYGATISYKELARTAGTPAAIRAAGTACGANRLVVLVPCHRVVTSSGGIGSYRYGTGIKTSLLRREHAMAS